MAPRPGRSLSGRHVPPSRRSARGDRADRGARREPIPDGCGYTNGGLPFTLSHSGLVVWMPDCVRYRRDGANEVEGVRPDVAIPWSELDGAERARALVRALAANVPATEP